MKLMKANQFVKFFMTAGLMAAALVYASSSYGQETSTADDAAPTTPIYLNTTTGYKIAGEIVLTAPGGTTDGNIALGTNAFTSNTTGTDNTSVGNASLTNNTTGFWNTAAGWEALHWNTTGSSNTAFGWQALVNNALTDRNTAVGVEALHNTDIDKAGLANRNTAIGWQAMFYNQDGASNTALGYQACLNITDGSDVTCIGANSGPAGNVSGPATFIANVAGVTLPTTDSPLVCIDPTTGQLGTVNCASSGTAAAQQAEINQKLQAQAERISELEQRLLRLESLSNKKSN